jgi:hypothetical protein
VGDADADVAESEQIGFHEEAPWDESEPEDLGASDCEDGSCGLATCARCCVPRWAHRCGFFGDLLYLRARDAEVAYAVAVDGATVPIPAPGNQIGPVALVDPDYETGYRVGYTRAWDECTSGQISFTQFNSSTWDRVSTDVPFAILSLVTHPGVDNAANNWLDARAKLDVDFELVNIDHRWLFSCGDNHSIDLLVGALYGRLEQNFQSEFLANGSRTIDSNVSFHGGGLRFGVEAERFSLCSGWMVYGRSSASFLAGEFSADYLSQSDLFGGGVEIDTAWEAGRVVTLLDLELGLGWTSCGGRLHMSAGYMFSAWLNTVQLDEFIRAVQTNNFVELGGDSTSFDGLVVRGEFRF